MGKKKPLWQPSLLPPTIIYPEEHPKHVCVLPSMELPEKTLAKCAKGCYRWSILVWREDGWTGHQKWIKVRWYHFRAKRRLYLESVRYTR